MNTMEPGTDAKLRDSLADLQLSNDEKYELRALSSGLDIERVRWLRNRAFDLARERLTAQDAQPSEVLRWLEQVIKTLDAAQVRPAIVSSAYFAPGDACLRKLRELCRTVRATLDICVFTISDDRLSEEILACHRRGVTIRLISDDDKETDDGSDISRLRQAGVPVRIDDSPFHMHHKFAVFDGRLLANGSFNWTRSATAQNEENLVVTDDANLVRSFLGHFDALWSKFG